MTEIARPPETSSEAPASPPSSLVPEAPPEPAWVEAEAEARARVKHLDETMQAQWRLWMETVASDVLDPLRTVVQQTAATHRRLVEEAAFGDAATTPAALWNRATAYRQAVAETMMTPLRDFLARRNFGEALGVDGLTMLEPLERLAEGAASHRTLPRPMALYAPEQEDPLPRRVRKSFARAKRRLQRAYRLSLNRLRRLFRQEPLPLPALHREAPVRDLCRYHVQVRLPGLLVQFHESVQQHIAGLVGRLETALTDWMHAVLDAEDRLNRLAFHQPDLLKTLAADDEETPEEPLEPERVDAFSGVAEALQQALMEIVEAIVLPEDLAAEQRLHAAAADLRDDLRRAGTFLLPPKTRTLPSPDKQPRIQRQSGVAWHEQAVNRLDVNGHLMTLRKTLLRLEDALLKGISDAVLRPVLQTFRPIAERLREAEQQAAQAADAAAVSGDLNALEATLRAVQEQTMDAVQEDLSDLSQLLTADQALAEPGRSEWEELYTLMEQIPGRLGEQDILRPFHELLTEPAKPLREEISTVWRETEQVGQVVQTSLDHALAVLKPSTSEKESVKTDADAPSKNPVEDARELATVGLHNAAGKLKELEKSLEAPWQIFAGAVFNLFQKDWAIVHRSARSETLDEQLFDIRVRLERGVQRQGQRAKEAWQKNSQIAVRYLKRAWRSLQRLIEHGRSAIGTVEATEEDRLRTIDAISRASLRALQERLPLVYRKLFSLRPVSEPSLLVALEKSREDDLQRVKQHVHRWKSKQAAGALILAMPLGSGRTSLLNAVGAKLHRTADVRPLTFTHRISDVSDFAASVAEALGIEGEPSLEALETQLLEAPRTEPPQVCLIDNLEHVLLRTLGGSDLVERVLIFFSRTDTKICWIATIGDYAWRFLEKTLTTATGLVTTYRPAMLDSTRLKDIIINRHQRSGIVLRFAEPTDLSRLSTLRRGLNRSRTDEARQTELQKDYFDRLFHLSGQNVMLALFYWLRSTDFEAEHGVLTIQPIEALSFRFFKSFDMARAFTLKAFLLHNTLTLEEHNRIFRMTDAESTYLLESLLNLRLIDPCRIDARRDAAGNPNRIFPDERYRLHPLILHPTFQLLRERNIIH